MGSIATALCKQFLQKSSFNTSIKAEKEYLQMKTSLAKAVALAATLGAAASAQAAISLNHNGQGEVLLYPMYTVENGNDTAISVTNTTGEFKVVKVRFREALNSQDVLDFHLFLSPKDVWNGVVVPTDDGAKLITRDTSCTVPAIPADGAAFTNLAYSGGAIETALRGEDGGPQDLKRTRVGYAEIIELGVLDPAALTSTAKAGGGFVTMAEAVKHVNGVPGNCGALVTEYLSGKWNDTTGDFSVGFKTPAQLISAKTNGVTNGAEAGANRAAGGLGGLYGVGTVTNVFAGQQIGYDATALDGFIGLVDATTAGGTAIGNLHNATGYSFPDLNGNRTPGEQVDIPEAGIGGSLVANVQGVDRTFRKTIDAVSALLQRPSLSNEFSVDAAVGAGTDWVVTFPTKHHYVWDSQIGSTGQRATFTGGNNSVIGAPPAPGVAYTDVPASATYADVVADYPTARAGQDNVSPFNVTSLWKGTNGNAKSEVPVKLGYLDREEKEVTVVSGISFSPRPSTPNVTFALSYEANVVTFNNSNVLVSGDSYARYNWSLENGYKSGWATIGLVEDDTVNIVTDATDTARGGAGLPAIGFATIKVANGDLGGVLSNYNAAWNHKSN